MKDTIILGLFFLLTTFSIYSIDLLSKNELRKTELIYIENGYTKQKVCTQYSYVFNIKETK